MGVPEDGLTDPDALDPLAAGVSRALAVERAGAIADLRYDLRMRVGPSGDDPVTGVITITFTLRAPARVVLDFLAPDRRLRSLRVNGWARRPQTVHNHVVVDAADTVAGENVLTCGFDAGPEALHWRDGWCYTLFVPARAHTCFPCFDQPDLKARLTLTLDLPADAVALANAPETGRDVTPEGVRWHFAETPPLSTYLLAFAAGRLAATDVPGDALPLRIFHPPAATDRVAADAPAVAALHAEALAWLEGYTGIPHPFPKLDLLLVPAFQFGGMEHPGAIYYHLDTLLPEDRSQAALEARAHLVAHETAHLWFGDLVTMPWFDDVWLKEVFANLMADRLRPAAATEGARLRFYLDHYPAAYDADRTGGARPIRQPLGNLARAGELYGPIAYRKSPIAMAALEQEMGAEAFRSAVRTYLAGGRWGTADWPALLRCCEAASGRPLDAWAERWITTAGRPEVRPDGPTWPALAYGHVRLAPDAVEGLLADPGADADPTLRAARWVALFESVCDGQLEAGRYAGALMAWLPHEPEAGLREFLRATLARVWWRWLGDEGRDALRPALEALEPGRRPPGDPGGTAPSAAELDWHAGLLVRSPADIERLVRRIAARTPGTDQDARLAFLAPALAVGQAGRSRLAAALGRGEWRVPERWVLEALELLHHPLRQEESVGWLPAHFEALPVIQRAGDIFFARRWVQAVLHGHRTVEAAGMVAAFVGSRPAGDHLRALVLEGADDLLRHTGTRAG